MSPFIVCLLFPMLCIFRSMLFLCYSNVKINCAVLLTSIVRSLSRPKVNSFCSQSYCWCVGYIILSSYVIQFSCLDSRSKPVFLGGNNWCLKRKKERDVSTCFWSSWYKCSLYLAAMHLNKDFKE